MAYHFDASQADPGQVVADMTVVFEDVSDDLYAQLLKTSPLLAQYLVKTE